jgi:hypothetical protein
VTVTDTDNPHEIQVNNTYVEKYKNFEFKKVWKNSSGELDTWPGSIASITVDLYANNSKCAEGIEISPTPPQDPQSMVNKFTWDGITYRCEVNADSSGKISEFAGIVCSDLGPDAKTAVSNFNTFVTAIFLTFTVYPSGCTCLGTPDFFI